MINLCLFLLVLLLSCSCDSKNSALQNLEIIEEEKTKCLSGQIVMDECDDIVNRSEQMLFECQKLGIEESRINAAVQLGRSRVGKKPDQSPFSKIKESIETLPFNLHAVPENFLPLKVEIEKINSDLFKVAGYSSSGKELRFVVIPEEMIRFWGEINLDSLAKFPILTKNQVEILDSSVNHNHKKTGNTLLDMLNSENRIVVNIIYVKNNNDINKIEENLTAFKVKIITKIKNRILVPHFKIFDKDGEVVEDSYHKEYVNTGSVILNLFPGTYRIKEEKSIVAEEDGKEAFFEVTPSKEVLLVQL